MTNSAKSAAAKFWTEVFCVIGVFILTNFVLYSFLGNTLFNGNRLEIQNHDTYLVIPKGFLIAVTFALLLILSYVLRWIHALTIGKVIVIVLSVLSTLLLVGHFVIWWASLLWIDHLSASIYSEINGKDRIQSDLLVHTALTLTLGVVALIDLILVHKLVKRH